MTEDQFVIDKAGVIPHAVFADGQCRNMSSRALRAAQRRHEAALSTWHTKATKAREEYKRMVAANKISPPSTLENLRQIADGHPDKPSVQAARRILKRLEDFREEME